MSRVLQLVTRDEPGGVRVLVRMVEQGLMARGHEVTTLALRDGQLAVVRAVWRGGYDAILSYQVAASLMGSATGWAARVPIRAIIANSTATLDAVAPYPVRYRSRMRLIAHGVVPLPRPARRDWRAALGIAPMAPMLVSSGRLVEQKNHIVAVAALAHLQATHLAIAGDGPLREPLLRQAEALGVRDRLHLVGELEPADLAGLLASSDIYVFPSHWESFGLAVVEAAMLGLPVVASNLPVLREVLAPAGRLARFHAAGDAGSLAQGVAGMLADYPASDMRRASARATRRAHSVERMIDAYCRLLAGSM